MLCQLPSYPALTLALSWAVIAGGLTLDFRRGRGLMAIVNVGTAGAFTALLGIVATFRMLNLVTWHSDSFRYAMVSALVSDSHVAEMSTNLLTKRMWGFPVLHAPAQIIGEYFFRSLAPLLALSTLWTLAWMVMEGLRLSGATKRAQCLMAWAAAILLASNTRFLWNAFYVNGHLLCALSTLVVAGASWLRVRGAAPALTYALLQNLPIPVLVATRPEGALMAGLAILPSLSSSQLPKAARLMLLSTLGASTLGWHGYVSYLSWRNSHLDASSLGMVALGALFLASVYALHRWRTCDRWLGYSVPAAEGLLWVGLIACYVLRPSIMRKSIGATVRNVAMGGASWGSSLLVLMALVSVTLVFTRSPARDFLRFPVTTFVPLALLLAPLRGEAYRVGNWDSLSRMLIHIVPLSILLVASSVTAPWSVPLRRRNRLVDSESVPLPRGLLSEWSPRHGRVGETSR